MVWPTAAGLCQRAPSSGCAVGRQAVLPKAQAASVVVGFLDACR
jgi:hypothetical protein